MRNGAKHILPKRWVGCAAWLALLLAVGQTGRPAQAQVAPASVRGDETVFVGATGSVLHTDYGARTLGGPRVFADAALTLRWGIEGSLALSSVHQRDDVHQTSLMAGPRVTFAHKGRWTFAAKGLVGGVAFYFPYGYGRGTYFAVAPGADVNFKICRRVRWEAVDAEYVLLPQFTFGAMREPTVGTGLRVRLF